MVISQNKRFYIYSGAIWCFLFAKMSFYWANGGMIGVKTLGGVIYKSAMEREPSFIAMVWLTGIVKLGGGLFILLLLRTWSKITNKFLFFLSIFRWRFFIFIWCSKLNHPWTFKCWSYIFTYRKLCTLVEILFLGAILDAWRPIIYMLCM